MRRLVKRLGIAVVGLLALGGMVILGARLVFGPLGPIPGPKLSGAAVEEPVVQWSFVDAIQTIQVETRPEAPYSVNTWVTRAGKRIYAFSSSEDKTWVRNILEDSRVRIRVDGRVHPCSAVRVTDLEEKRAFLLQMRVKYGDHFEFDLQAWEFQWDTGEIVLFRLEPR